MSRILIVPLAIIFHASLSLAKAPYCVPGQQCFPSPSEISAFNASISGRLTKPPPYASVCYTPTFSLSACQNLFAEEASGDFRIELPSALMYTNWELDDQGKGCPQPAVEPTGLISGTCTLGSLAAYEVFATDAQDISLAVKFAAKYNLRLRIKNTGHDYIGRSSAAGSFTIWTHHMNSSSFSASFKPTGCNVSPQQALIVGPGISVNQLYEAADRAGVVSIGGFVPTVGASGGFVAGGGTGPLTRKFGMGVDNALQFQVVTADGSIKIANQCTNTDLFWALRGGGGGTFAIQTEVVFKAHPALTGINTVSGTLTANSTAAWSSLVQAWLAFHVTLDKLGAASLSETFNPIIILVAIQPFTAGKPSSPAEFLALFDSLKSIPGVVSNISASAFSTWLEAYDGVVKPTIEVGSTVGDNLILADRVIPQSIFATNTSLEPLAQVIAGLNTSAILQFVVGEAVSTADQTATSINPAWRDALMHINFPVFGTGAVTASQNATVLAIAQAVDKAVFPAGATPVAYYNEDFAHEPNAQRVWWGKNYDRLLQIKKAVDPNGVFSCRECVGSEINGF